MRKLLIDLKFHCKNWIQTYREKYSIYAILAGLIYFSVVIIESVVKTHLEKEAVSWSFVFQMSCILLSSALLLSTLADHFKTLRSVARNDGSLIKPSVHQSRLPRLGLALCLIPKRQREQVEGDLDEEYLDLFESKGQKLAAKWYKMQVWRSIVPYLSHYARTLVKWFGGLLVGIATKWFISK